jgi:hypothetical protein
MPSHNVGTGNVFLDYILFFCIIDFKRSTASVLDIPSRNSQWDSVKNFSECTSGFSFNVFAYIL